MIAKEIKYMDYDGIEHVEKFYFHMNKAELIEMNMGIEGGMEAMLRRIVETQDVKRIMEMVKDLIKASYGEKSGDGKRFIKNDELLEAFMQSEAYVELFMELAADADKLGEFVRGILPADIAAQVAVEEENNRKAGLALVEK